MENLGDLVIIAKHQSQPNVPQLDLNDMLMSGSEVLRESSVSKVVAADPADYLADQSGGNQSSINGPSRGQSSSTHFV